MLIFQYAIFLSINMQYVYLNLPIYLKIYLSIFVSIKFVFYVLPDHLEAEDTDQRDQRQGFNQASNLSMEKPEYIKYTLGKTIFFMCDYRICTIFGCYVKIFQLIRNVWK